MTDTQWVALMWIVFFACLGVAFLGGYWHRGTRPSLRQLKVWVEDAIRHAPIIWYGEERPLGVIIGERWAARRVGDRQFEIVTDPSPALAALLEDSWRHGLHGAFYEIRQGTSEPVSKE